MTHNGEEVGHRFYISWLLLWMVLACLILFAGLLARMLDEECRAVIDYFFLLLVFLLSVIYTALNFKELSDISHFVHPSLRPLLAATSLVTGKLVIRIHCPEVLPVRKKEEKNKDKVQSPEEKAHRIATNFGTFLEKLGVEVKLSTTIEEFKKNQEQAPGSLCLFFAATNACRDECVKDEVGGHHQENIFVWCGNDPKKQGGAESVFSGEEGKKFRLIVLGCDEPSLAAAVFSAISSNTLKMVTEPDNTTV
eukprot:TRINITY_DN17855_c0_g1_i1.p1 TRINITY_DN17855_c0_g1~~TRINITY_DN17855_c0_g1_i1.p1  ORF type:complete len:251 (+),score=71.98 TRINITY_DN17855_c0_g1_i1:791-1543(+)